MKRSLDGFQALVASPEDLHKHLSTLQSINVIDLGNGGIVGDKIADIPHFIALSTSPVALLSIDFGHNRIGDAGAIALARLTRVNATKLTNLKALDLFENGIRDKGALALMNAIQKGAAADRRHAARQRRLRNRVPRK